MSMPESSLRSIILTGTPCERGRAHGEAFRPQILQIIGKWKEWLSESRRGDPDKHLSRFVRETQHVDAVKRWTPDLSEEIVGLSEGSGVPFDVMFAWQCQGAEEWYSRPITLEVLRAKGEQCTALGVSGHHGLPTMIAQNLDVPRLREGYALVQHIRDPESDLEYLVVGSMGSIGDSGLNNRPLGVVENTVSQLDHCADGLPDFMVARGVIAQRTLDEAVRFVRSVKHACGHNYLIGSTDRLADLECSANRVVEFAPLPGGKRTWHSNHPLANDDQGQWDRFLAELPVWQRQQIAPRSTTVGRLEAAERLLRDDTRPVTMEAIRTLLCSHEAPVCIHNERLFTASSIVQVLSTSPELHITDGPPCSNPYHRFSF